MKREKFVMPLAEIIDFVNDDIITLSGVEKNGIREDDDNSEIWSF